MRCLFACAAILAAVTSALADPSGNIALRATPDGIARSLEQRPLVLGIAEGWQLEEWRLLAPKDDAGIIRQILEELCPACEDAPDPPPCDDEDGWPIQPRVKFDLRGSTQDVARMLRAYSDSRGSDSIVELALPFVAHDSDRASIVGEICPECEDPGDLPDDCEE